MEYEKNAKYCVTATTRWIKEKEILRLLVPVFVWLLLFLVLFVVMCRTEIWFLLLAVVITFLSIIPISIVSYKKCKKLNQESCVQTELMLTARDGAIYKDDMKLNVAYSVLDNEVYFDDERDLGKYNHCHMTFCGIIGGDDVKGFVAFCRENGVEIEVFNVM